MLTPDQKNIIDLLIKQEKMLAHLYTIFSDTFVKHTKFWKKLAENELLHAKWLEQLYEAGEGDVVYFDEKKITKFSLETFIKGVEEAIRKAELNELDDKKALVLAADFERSLIEKSIFSNFRGLSDKANNLMKNLEEQTREHLSLVESMRRQELVS